MPVSARRRMLHALTMLGPLACACAQAAHSQARDLAAVQVRSQYTRYRALGITGATGTDAPLRDLPISARVPDRTSLEMQACVRLPGVHREPIAALTASLRRTLAAFLAWRQRCGFFVGQRAAGVQLLQP